MLATFRKSVNHIATKIFLGLLVLTFILWGVGDILRASKDNIALQVGDIEYTKAEWHNFYRAQFDRMGDEYKQIYGINSKELQSLFLKQLINSALLDRASKDIGISIGDDAVKYEIINNTSIFTRDGKFDKDLLNNFLKQSNISESFFIEKIREELRQRVVADIISSANLLNNILLEQITKAVHTQRKIEIYRANPYSISVIDEPTDDELQDILQKNQTLFTVPEKRRITLIKFDIGKTYNEKIPYSEIEAFYNQKSYLFTLPEKRKFFKIAFRSESDARANYEKLTTGQDDFIKLGTSLRQDIGINNHPVTKDGMDNKLADLIFSLEQNKISEPIFTPFGWCIFQVAEIIPAFIQPISSVKGEIEEHLKQQYLHDHYMKKIADIENDLNQNITIEEIAISHNLKLQNIDLTIAPVMEYQDNSLSKNEAIISAAASMNIGDTSDVIQSIPNNQNVVIRLDSIKPSYIMVFDQIKNQLKSLWRESLQKRKATECIYDLHKKMIAGEDVAIDKNVEVKHKLISISDNNQFIPEQLIEIFRTPINIPTRIFDYEGDKFFIKTLSVKTPSEAQIKEYSKREADKLGNMSSILMNDYLIYLQKIYKVKIYDVTLPEF